MRIISGIFGGRKFFPPADKWPTRPTTDVSKEALFNILNNLLDFEDTRMLDLFGGTGNHCFEFISRGCTDATYVDKFAPAVAYVRKLSKELNVENEITIVQSDVFKFISSTKNKYNYIFAGPPYPLENIPEIPDLIFTHGLLAEDGIFVIETNPQHSFKHHPNFSDLRKYGSTHFSFFKN
ncbi:MAG TPA: RsmD family RNA methyltransferase [Saprospiraceae bacterium]|nr:RsmD family RNA methyltransferase [Saprospiraceae bacterium]